MKGINVLSVAVLWEGELAVMSAMLWEAELTVLFMAVLWLGEL
jgi:hypothetical protein